MALFIQEPIKPPIQEPEFEFEFDAEHGLHFILEYDFLPKSIFTRFIIKMHRDIMKNTYWRNGILLRESASNTTALVETDNKRIILQITGQREYLAILLFILKDIHRRFSVNHDYLLKLAAKGRREYLPPENQDKFYKISDLLGIVAPQTETETMQMLEKIVRILEIQGIKEEKDLLAHIDEVVKVNPTMFGVSIDVNALVRKMIKK
ncbi:hypothetical protein PN36_30655 [Candidatus Thiomargarita nelsonii]|uniref:C-terminal of Roc COR-B domain-containing protein n=1 Tax=Candidatus Thiomargarita nelsonii TaxID=1003181 RepID=A0A0A6PFX8_9GAMM|nr:hypothetical protein PN36_30655 [Candidatus Thiomargarita nelsonii]